MHDLPSQTLLQQSAARPKSGEELEILGKQASALYRCGGCSLNDSVVETVKKAGLSPEQVKRVCEFANTDAYLKDFEKKGSTHKYIAFEGGPANPSEVLKDLNDGGGGTIFDDGSDDYSHGPMGKSSAVLLDRNRAAMGLEKTANSPFSPAETAFEQMWQADDKPLPYAEPLQDSFEMRDKLAAAEDQLRHELNTTEIMFAQASEDLYQLVKQASDTVPLGHVLQVWQEAVPGPGFVKAAFALIGPRLVREGVFKSLDAMGGSLEKTASRRLMVNTAHPLVSTFAAYCGTLEKLAHLREARKEVASELGYIDNFLKVASQVKQGGAKLDALRVAGGLIPKASRSAWSGAGRMGQALEKPVGTAFGALGGPGAGRVGEVVGKHGPKALLAAAGLTAGEAGYQRLKHSPVGTAASYGVQGLKARMPGTPEYNWRLAAYRRGG